jgi:hypothetical protein
MKADNRSQARTRWMTQAMTTARLMACILLVAMVAFFTAATPGALAQTSTGQIKGVITDPSGAVVPGATVTAISLDNGFTRTAVTRSDGSFLIPELDPQHYKIQVLAPNFKRLERGPITVQVTETADVGRIPLSVGTEAQTVTVEAQAQLLQTENATLGKVFDSESIEALPLSTRNFTQLLSLQAGVIGAIPSTLVLGNATAQFSVGGGRVYDNAVNIDGVNAVSSSATGSYSVPSPDALDEFKMQTSTYSAEYGRAGGGNIDVTTKSGTNQFHGDGFYFFRNKALDANSYFNKQGQLANGNPNVAPDVRQNQWGGTIGGPVLRNRLFFFFSFQSTNQINGNAGTINNQAYPQLPSGDRSNGALLAQQLGAIYGGQVGLLGGNPVAADGSNINPVAIKILQAKNPDGSYILPYFAPQSATGLSNVAYAHFSLLPTFTEKQYLANVDYKITDKQTLSTKFFDSHTSYLSLTGSLPGFTSTTPGVNDNDSIKDTYTISPTLVNEFKVGYMRQYADALYKTPSGFTASSVGMIPVIDGQDVFPQWDLLTNGIVIQGRGFNSNVENQYSIADVVSKTLGRHNLRIGGTVLDHQLQINSAGTWGSGAIITYNTADFLLSETGTQNGSGISNLLVTAGNSGTFLKNYRFVDAGYFVQDDYKVTPRLTVNAGLRWDYFAWPSETKGRLDNFVRDLMGEGLFGIPTVGQQYTGYTIAAAFQKHNPGFQIPAGVTTVNDQDGATANWKNYAPRVGFAWSPENNLSIRGGFGLFFSRTSSVLAQSLISGPPFNNSDLYSFGTDGDAQDPFTHLGLPPDSAFPIWTPRQYSPTATPSLLFNAVADHLSNPYTEQWNLDIQQQVNNNLLFELAYQGQNGVKLLQALSQNQAAIASVSNPIRGITTNITEGGPGGSLNIQGRSPVAGLLSDEGLSVSQTTASSHFNALEATLDKRLSHGLQLLSAFTWSRDFDSNTVGFNGAGSSAVPPNDNNTTHHMSISGLDRTLRFTTSAVYQVPNPIRSAQNFAEQSLSRALGGWAMSSVIVAQTGPPTQFGLAAAATGSSAIKLQGNLTASLAPGVRLEQVQGHGAAIHRLTHYFNTGGLYTVVSPAQATAQVPAGSYPCGTSSTVSAFVCPGPTEFGDLPTNTSIRAPGQKTVDFSLTKTTKVYENYTVEVRADFFNFFNWANFAAPDSGPADSTFGLINGTTVDPRVIQVAAKVKF